MKAQSPFQLPRAFERRYFTTRKYVVLLSSPVVPLLCSLFIRKPLPRPAVEDAALTSLDLQAKTPLQSLQPPPQKRLYCPDINNFRHITAACPVGHPVLSPDAERQHCHWAAEAML